MVVLVLIGQAFAGKTTCELYLTQKYGFKALAFAAPLKKVCQEIFDLSQEQLFGNQKEVPDSRFGNKTPREILQFVGTDLFRKQLSQFIPEIGEDIWCMKLFRQIEPNKNYIISDCRLEFQQIKNHNFGDRKVVFLRIKRDVAGSKFGTHASETEMNAIPDDQVDFIVDNNSSIADLYRRLDEIVQKIMIFCFLYDLFSGFFWNMLTCSIFSQNSQKKKMSANYALSVVLLAIGCYTLVYQLPMQQKINMVLKPVNATVLEKSSVLHTCVVTTSSCYTGSDGRESCTSFDDRYYCYNLFALCRFTPNPAYSADVQVTEANVLVRKNVRNAVFSKEFDVGNVVPMFYNICHFSPVNGWQYFCNPNPDVDVKLAVKRHNIWLRYFAAFLWVSLAIFFIPDVFVFVAEKFGFIET